MKNKITDLEIKQVHCNESGFREFKITYKYKGKDVTGFEVFADVIYKNKSNQELYDEVERKVNKRYENGGLSRYAIKFLHPKLIPLLIVGASIVLASAVGATIPVFLRNEQSTPAPVPPEPRKIVSTTTLTVSHVNSEETITFGCGEIPEYIEVDWGDETSEDDYKVSHKYNISIQREFQITIIGKLDTFVLSNEEGLLSSFNNNITCVEIGEGITNLPSHAFKGYENAVIIPESLVTIESAAFDNADIYCKATAKPDGWADDWADIKDHNFVLGFIEMDENNDYAYAKTTNGAFIIERKKQDETEITIDKIDGLPVIGIGRQAFYDHDEITLIDIPNSVTNVGRKVFADCNELKRIRCDQLAKPDSWPNDWVGNITTNVYWDYQDEGDEDNYHYIKSSTGAYIESYSDSINGEFVIKPTLGGLPVKGIQNRVFKESNDLTSIKLPDTLEFIGNEAFASNPNLTEITFPESLKTIGDEAFASNPNLTQITFPKSLKTIGDGAFYSTVKLKLSDVFIPASVLNIGAQAFYFSSEYIYCGAEEQPDGWAEDWCYVDTVVCWGCIGCGTTDDGLKYAITPNGINIVKYIGNAGALTIPQNIEGNKVIGILSQAFKGNGSLKSVTILPDSVTSIGSEAFQNTELLEEVTIPKGVTTIEKDAFGLTHATICVEYEEEEKPEGWDEEWSGDEANVQWGCVNPKHTEKFKYAKTPNGGIKIISYIEETEGPVNVTIPETIDDLPVVRIGASAFKGCDKVESIVMPNTIYKIEDYVFQGCTKLETIDLRSISKDATIIPVCTANTFFDLGTVIDILISNSALEEVLKANGWPQDANYVS